MVSPEEWDSFMEVLRKPLPGLRLLESIQGNAKLVPFIKQ
jgi:hypothetical protein